MVADDRALLMPAPRATARRLALSAVCAFGLTLGWSATPALGATQTFISTGAEQTFTVPAGVTSIHVVAIGASGGAGGNSGGAGGAPAQVSGDLSVTPGQVLYVEVAGNGNGGSAAQNPGAGGFNGGGSGGGGANGGGGGGGATDVRISPMSVSLTSSDSRLMVAAGGGGGGANAGGGTGGAAGSNGSGNFGGSAGTSSAGGAGGCGGSACVGALGVGGAGFQTGGGGGAGYYGGGGGACPISSCGAGGGGSSLVPAGGSKIVVALNTPPQVQIIYTPGSSSGGGGTTPTNPTNPTKPTVSSLGETNSTFVVGGSSTPLTGLTSARRHKRGTTFSFRLDQSATVRIAIQTRSRGRRVGHTCKPDSRRLRRRPRCTRTVTIATLTRTAHAGLNRVAFSGRIRGKALKPGRYQAVFTATDSAGASPPRGLSFTIVRR
jgi:glycine rich protein